MREKFLDVIPQPREIPRFGQARFGKVVLTDLANLVTAYLEQFTELVELLEGDGGPLVCSTDFSTFGTAPEGYELDIDHQGVHIRASTALGALHAARTLVDLWDSNGDGTLPEVHIVDRPTFSTRGVFVESFAGTDRMELPDWKLFVDRMGQLKFNTIGLSIYGCWDIHHDGGRSEYLFTPLEDFPNLETPQRVVTWDPDEGREVEHRYLPKMFEHDFFGEVVRYAARQGIEVIPHLGGPGHSSLIPRGIPELSAVDEQGKPTGYGYCVSRPAAKEALARLVRCLARQHLIPNGVGRLHVAGDEYYPIQNIDPQDRTRIGVPTAAARDAGNCPLARCSSSIYSR